jgi:hypothetical protein
VIVRTLPVPRPGSRAGSSPGAGRTFFNAGKQRIYLGFLRSATFKAWFYWGFEGFVRTGGIGSRNSYFGVTRAEEIPASIGKGVSALPATTDVFALVLTLELLFANPASGPVEAGGAPSGAEGVSEVRGWFLELGTAFRIAAHLPQVLGEVHAMTSGFLLP